MGERSVGLGDVERLVERQHDRFALKGDGESEPERVLGDDLGARLVYEPRQLPAWEFPDSSPWSR